MTVVLKVGGSVITEKDRRETIDAPSLSAVASAISAGRPDETNLVLVHGGGSFGHPVASDHGVDSRTGTCDPAAARAIHAAMGRLNGAVLDALGDVGIPAVPIHPLSMMARDESGTLTVGMAAVDRLLEAGMVPVLHGDVVSHAGAGFTVVSGDTIVVALAERVDADRIGVCSTVSGVHDGSGAVIPVIDSYAAVAEAVGESEATDVTGGMAGKVRALLEASAPAHVFDVSGLEAFLSGGTPGTRID